MTHLIIPVLLGCSILAAAVVGGEEMRTLGKGTHSGITRAGERVIRSADGWQKLWKEHTANMEPPAPLPAVDFTREMVIAVFMGEQRTGGYAIEVARVAPGPKALVVEVRRASPRPGGIGIQVLTQPFHFVAVKKSELPVRFTAAPPDQPPAPSRR
jgi:hypothetical protein